MLNKIISCFLCLMLCISTLDAKPGSGGSSHSSSGSRSSSSGTSSSRSSMPSSNRSTTSSPSRSAPSGVSKPKQGAAPTQSRSSPSGVKPTPSASKPTTTKSNVDNKVNKMVKVGNTNMTKDQAINKFKSDHSSTYTSKYKSEPASRPSHIPSSYSSGGHTYNISYNHGMGGYGYYGPSGAWMMYDAFRDVAVMNMLLNNHGYRDVVVTGGGDGVVSDGVVTGGNTVVVTRHNGFFQFCMGVMFILILVTILILAFRDK